MSIEDRKEREKLRRQQQILVAARRVFSRQGFAGATMDDVAQEAELSPGTLYLYFKNKDELFATLCLRIFDYLIMRVEDLIADASSGGREKVEALREILFDVYDFDPEIINYLFHLQSSEKLRNFSPKLLGNFDESSRKARDVIAGVFKQAIEDDYLLPEDPGFLSDIFWATYSGVILWEASKTMLNSKKDFLKSTLSIAFDIFFNGVKKPSDTR